MNFEFFTKPLESILSFWKFISDQFPNKKFAYITLAYYEPKEAFDLLAKDQHNYDILIIDSSSEYYPVEEIAKKEFLNNIKIPYVVLTSNPFFKQQKFPVVYFPAFYFDVYYRNKPVDLPKNKRYIASCLNRFPRPGRIHNYVLLNQSKYFKDILFSFKSIDPYAYNEGDDYSSVIISYEDTDWSDIEHFLSKKGLSQLKEQYKDLYKLLPINPLDDDIIYDDHCQNHPAYTESLCNIVTETFPYDVPFLTEKTFKPLATGIPVFLHSGYKSLSVLNDMGFDTYSDIIDTSYDDILDYNERTIKMHQSLNMYLESPYYNYDRTMENQAHFFSPNTHEQLAQPLKNLLQIL